MCEVNSPRCPPPPLNSDLPFGVLYLHHTTTAEGFKEKKTETVRGAFFGHIIRAKEKCLSTTILFHFPQTKGEKTGLVVREDK